MHSAPVKVALPPWASTMPSCRCSRPSSAAVRRATTSSAAQALAQEREPVAAVARVRVRLRRDRADARLGPGHDRADGEELRLRRDAPLARRRGRRRRSSTWRRRAAAQPYVSSVRSSSSSAGIGDEGDRHLGPRERRLHLGGGAPRGRRRGGPRRGRAQRARSSSVVEHERVVEVELAFERDLGDPASRSRRTSALSKLDRPSRLDAARPARSSAPRARRACR